MVFDERTGPSTEWDAVRVLKISSNTCGVERFDVDLIVLDGITIDERDLESPFVSDYVAVGRVAAICFLTVPICEGEVNRGVLCIHTIKFYGFPFAGGFLLPEERQIPVTKSEITSEYSTDVALLLDTEIIEGKRIVF